MEKLFKLFLCIALIFAVCLRLILGAPEGFNNVTITSNTTKNVTAAYNVSIAGGYIAALNITANIRNVRWKGFVGWVTGKFTLADGNGSTLFDWSMSTTSGRVYATRHAATITWANINCSNLSKLELENYQMNHTNKDDNISRTFNETNHTSFYVGTKSIPSNTCFSLNTYVNNASSYDFDEMVLDDGSSVVYATILENRVTGYNSMQYDFQMIVPENGAATFSGITPYYLYVELT
ncbi:MAG: hypothetical protein ACP5OG_05590 [Candidatus Nanoarchaeia archaeon]